MNLKYVLRHTLLRQIAPLRYAFGYAGLIPYALLP